MTKIIDSISDIISLYDVFILDQWGVMHDGYKGYDHAINSVEKLIKENKKLMENSAKALNFIEASTYRDNIKFLKEILTNKNKY